MKDKLINILCFLILIILAAFSIYKMPALKGEPGQQGIPGEKGDTGIGIIDIIKTDTVGLIDTYTITFTDGTEKTFTVTNGSQGIQGIQGDKGQDGYSPIITIQNSYWYIDGINTNVKAEGIDGNIGNGISDISKTDTVGLVDIYTIIFTDGSKKEFSVTNGKDGVSVNNLELTNEGDLSVILSNGTNINLGNIKGQDGIGIDDIKIDSNDHLKIILSSGITLDLGNIKGSQGEQGIPGSSINDANINSEGELILKLTDGNSINAGKVVGSSSQVSIIKISQVKFNESGELIFILEDETELNCGLLPRCEHSYKDWSTKEEPTCTSIGVEIRDCTKCGYIDYNFTQKTEHDFSDWNTERHPTCTSIGINYRKCLKCNLIDYEFIDELEHNFNEWKIISSTCIEVQKIRTCKSCAKVEYKIDDPIITTHNFIDYKCYYCHCLEESENLTYSLLSDDTYSITSIKDLKGDTLIIPEEYNDKKVTEIDCSLTNVIKNIIISKNITRINGQFNESLENLYYYGTASDWCKIKFNSESYNPMYYANKVYFLNSAYDWIELNEIVLDESVKNINNYQFAGLNHISKVFIPESVESIGVGAFHEVKEISEITIPFVGKSREAQAYEAVFGYIFGYYSMYNMVGESSTEESLDFMNTCDITIPDNAIWQYTCINYKSSTNYLENSYCYYIPQTIKKVIITNQEHLPVAAFNGCLNIENIILNDNLLSIGDYAFNNCSSLSELIIPNTVTLIGHHTFYTCSSLKTISLSTLIDNIPMYSFYNCTKLENVIIPNNVEKIEKYAFFNCSSLNYIVLDVTIEINKNAFMYCENLNTIYNTNVETIELGTSENGYIGKYAEKIYNKNEWEFIDGIPKSIIE